MKKRKITIAIPYYQSQDNLDNLLLALANQKILNFEFKLDIEVIIVNDEFKNILLWPAFKKYGLNLKIINQEHSGVAAARNRALEIAKGDIIFFLDQDCIPMSNWLENIFKRFIDDPQIDAIGGQIQPLSKVGLVNEYFNFINTLKQPIVDKLTKKIVTIITANSGFRVVALRQIGGFDQKVFDVFSHGGEDVDLTYRLIKNGYRIDYEPAAIVLHCYPDKFRAIFFKYANYGKGMRLFCLSRNINPILIRQPNLSFFSFLKYCFLILFKFKESYQNFKQIKNIRKVLLFIFFDLVRYLGHGYGYFYGNYKSKSI